LVHPYSAYRLNGPLKSPDMLSPQLNKTLKR
jgi:hypothetical protein